MSIGTEKLINKLFVLTKDTLPDEILDKIDGNTSLLELEADSIADTLEFLSAAMQHDDQNAHPTDSQMASILWGLSERTKTLSALLFIQSEAGVVLNKRVEQGGAS